MHEDVGVYNYPHRCGHLDGAEKIGDAWNNFESFEVCRLALFRTPTPSSHLLHLLVIYSLSLQSAGVERRETTPGRGDEYVDVDVDEGNGDGEGDSEGVGGSPASTSIAWRSSTSHSQFHQHPFSSDTGDIDEDDSPPSHPNRPHPHPRPAASPSSRLPTIGVSSFSSKLQLARSRTAGIDAEGRAAGLGLGLGLGLERELEPRKDKGERKSGHDDRGNAIVYIDDTAMVVEPAGPDDEGESEGDGGVVHVHGSGCTSVGPGAVLDGDDGDDDMEPVVVEANGKEGAGGSAGAGHSEAEDGDEGPPGIETRDTAPECESEFEVVADDLPATATPARTTLPTKASILLLPLQAPADEDHDHDGGNESAMDVDDDEDNELRVRVTKAKEDGGDGDGEGDTGSRGVGNLEVEVERDNGRAAAGALDQADEFSGREGEPGEDINQNYNTDDEAGDLDASNGFVDDGAGVGGRDEEADRAAAGVNESTVDNGESDDARDEGRDDGHDVNFTCTGPDTRQLDNGDGDGDGCNLAKNPAKSSSTPDRDDEIKRLRQALENEQKTSADTQDLQTALRALQDEIDREVEACMCGAQRELGSEDGDGYDVAAVELEKNRNGKRRLFNEDENQEEDGVDDLGEAQGSENFSVEDPPRSRFKRARIE
ncbi:hypothetical protein GALMADRAFT_216623 [Galerina marginata CBS 339.88]|uniref:Uncharacterized protein n=1 Tax=Galerina marginata (strain CBS 339.88) TaxID=685588 RepID=A0A067SHC7_GALM3|nr:hypothetical protein GALMADRAFT_216623 [Galerina marginata CBS 339.88]